MTEQIIPDSERAVLERMWRRRQARTTAAFQAWFLATYGRLVSGGKLNFAAGSGGGATNITVSFVADGSQYIVAPGAITYGAAIEAGTGTVAYAVALAAAPTTFNADTLPITLATGDILRITVSGLTGYKSVTLVRTA